jgi:glycosyltransferase involved in cell wall biosynthesis
LDIWIYYRDFVRPDEEPGGMSKAINGYAGALAHAALTVTLICERAEEATIHSPAGYTVRAFARRDSVRHGIPKTLASFLDEEKTPDLAILNGMFTPNVAQVARRLRKRSVPYVVAPHDPYSPAMFARRRILKLAYWNLIERPLLQHASGVQVLDERHARWLRKMGVDTPAVDVPNGYSAEDVPPESDLVWDEHRPAKALFLGRIDAFNKGLDVLVDAIGPMNGDVSLVIQGPDWGDKKRLARQSEEAGTRVEFRAPDYTQTSTELMSAYDIVCLPSRFEGFGLAVLEAMLAARVVLVSDDAGVSPHVKKCGCGVVVTADTAGVRAGLGELLAARQSWREMGLAGRAYALENLRWDDIVDHAVEDYTHILPPFGRVS